MTHNPRRELLLEILSFARPHDTPTEKAFCREFLDKVPGMVTDLFGNRYLRIGTAPILWSCHVDTVARHCGPQEVAFNPASGLASLAKPRNKMSLGADDGVGIWIMLNMIEAGMEGLYVFHRGEEVGGLGSTYIAEKTPQLLDGIQMAIAWDRDGYSDVITHQSFGKTASDGFAWSLARQLNNRSTGMTYRPDATGIFTDTNNYAHLVPECSNVSVGYFNQHSKDEMLDVYHAEKLLDAILLLDLDALVVEREAGDDGYSGGSQAWGRDNWWDVPTMAEMEDAVAFYPEAAAALLIERGVTLEDIYRYQPTQDAARFPADLDGNDVPFDDAQKEAAHA